MPIILNVSESSSFCPHLPTDSDLRLKKDLAFLAVPLEFPEANADTEAMAVDLCRNVRTFALMLLSSLIFIR